MYSGKYQHKYVTFLASKYSFWKKVKFMGLLRAEYGKSILLMIWLIRSIRKFWRLSIILGVWIIRSNQKIRKIWITRSIWIIRRIGLSRRIWFNPKTQKIRRNRIILNIRTIRRIWIILRIRTIWMTWIILRIRNSGWFKHSGGVNCSRGLEYLSWLRAIESRKEVARWKKFSKRA